MSEIICDCLGVTRDQIEEAVKAGANTVDAVGDATQAGNACGACRDQIEEIVTELTK